MTPKNGFLLFIASCLSGCGQMYQGYMKRGVSLLLSFFLVIFVSTYFYLGTLALFLPVIWLYAFFDSYALRSQLSAGTAPEDTFLFGLSDMDSKRLGALLHKGGAEKAGDGARAPHRVAAHRSAQRHPCFTWNNAGFHGREARGPAAPPGAQL